MARGHEWKQGAWADSARGSQNELFADAQETGSAVAVGEAGGDAAAVAVNTESFDHDWHDADDADAFGLDETKRECDAARAELAFATSDAEARREDDEDGLTTEESRDVPESVSSLERWERFPANTQAAEKNNNTQSAQTIRKAAVAAENPNEPEDDTALTEVQPWKQRQAVHAAAVLNEMADLHAERKGSQQQQGPPPKCPVRKHRGKAAFNLLATVRELPVPTTPSPTPRSPPSPKGVAAVAVEPHASSPPTAPTAPIVHMTVDGAEVGVWGRT